MDNRIKLSIIIVHYKNETDLFECLDSLYKQNTKIIFEVIVVDNSEDNNVQALLNAKKYQNLKYILASKNLGYGAGMNLGAKYANGKYLFVLNPDVVFKSDIISSLINKISKNDQIGIVAPLLYSTNNKIMEQGTRELTPLRALIKYSFLDKLFPNNPISKNYWVNNWKIDKLKQVDNVPGTALIIKKEVFDNVGGFDERFFLYFEEFDLCKRVREQGYKIFIDPTSRLIHKWGTSTRLLKNKDSIFKTSRFYYFKKHFGLVKALLVESFLSINKHFIFLSLIILLAFFVRVFKVDSLVPFIGDQGWFFISAKNALLANEIPLVGITSSHLWLHQGALWTYILMFLFKLFNFNPTIPFVLTALVDGFVVVLIYKLISNLFSQRVAMLSTFIYAFSPVVILSARMSYHTSLIPLFILLFIYSLINLIKGKKNFLSLSIFSLAILYNLELQASILAMLFILILIYGFVKKTDWFKNILNKKTLLLSLIALFIPMLPILIFDLNNGFPQTIVFTGWILYKGASFFTKIFSGSSTNFNEYILILDYFYEFVKKLLFMQSGIISLIISLSSVVFVIYKLLKEKITKEENKILFLIFIILVSLVGGIFVSKTPSDAYLMSLFIPSILIVSIMLDYISKNKRVYLTTLLLVILISLSNIIYLISNDYFTGVKKNFGPNLSDRIVSVKEIIKDSKDKSITVIGRGEGSQFESFTDNYKYLLWFYGKETKERNGDIIYVLSESRRGITIDRRK